MITIDFVIGLPHTTRGYDSIWVIVDHLTKSAHFLHVQTTYSVALEDMLRMCVLDFGGQYHSTIGMAPYEALYGWKYT